MKIKVCSAKSGKVRWTTAKKTTSSRINFLLKELGMDANQYRHQANLRTAMRMLSTPLNPFQS